MDLSKLTLDGDWADVEEDEASQAPAQEKQEQKDVQPVATATGETAAEADQMIRAAEELKKRETLNSIPEHPPFRIMVKNIKYSADEKDIAEVFGCRSLMDVNIVRDRDGRSKGFAFVEVEKREDMVDTLTELQGAKIQGRAVEFVVANQRGGPNRRGGGGRTGTQRTSGTKGGGGGGPKPGEKWAQRRQQKLGHAGSGASVPSRPSAGPPKLDQREQEIDFFSRAIDPSPSSAAQSPVAAGTPSASRSTANPFGDARPNDPKAFWERKRPQKGDTASNEAVPNDKIDTSPSTAGESSSATTIKPKPKAWADGAPGGAVAAARNDVKGGSTTQPPTGATAGSSSADTGGAGAHQGGRPRGRGRGGGGRSGGGRRGRPSGRGGAASATAEHVAAPPTAGEDLMTPDDGFIQVNSRKSARGVQRRSQKNQPRGRGGGNGGRRRGGGRGGAHSDGK